MSAEIKNMTEGRAGRLIFSFAIPLMAGNIFQQLYTVVDTMVVGKCLGMTALAAIGASDWLNWMVIGIAQGLTQGFAINMAQEFGAGNDEMLRKVVGNSSVLAGIFSVLLVILGQSLAKPILLLLRTPDEIFPYTMLYVRIMFLGLPIIMLYNLFACMLRSLGDSKTPLNAMIVASITNIILDILFVYVFRWGIAGAAIATLIAQMVSSIFCFMHIRKIEILSLKKTDFCMNKRLAGHLLYLGSPMAFQNMTIAIGGMIIQAVANGFGVVFIAGFTATNKLYGVLEIAATSYGYAILTYVGQNLGAKKTKRIHEGIRIGFLIAVSTSIVISAVMLLFGKLILGWFVSGTPEEIDEAIRVGYSYLKIMSSCLSILYILYVLRSAIQGIGNTFLPMLSGIAEFCMRTSGVLLLPRIIGETGVFLAEVMAWFGADVVLIISYFVVIRRLPKE